MFKTEVVMEVRTSCDSELLLGDEELATARNAKNA
jgi:hypothetical protein